ncbi:TPA: pathogenicity island protein [Staphylococcus aureus]
MDQQKAIQELEQERNALESKIKLDKSTYKQLIMDGQDDKADNLYQATDADEKKLKALNKRLETKKSVSKEVKYQKTIELLKHQSELASLYESEKQSALGKLKKVVDAYNEIIDEIEDINDRYEDEHQQYASIYSQEQLYDDKEAREALNGYFRENIFTSYINGNDLPYEHNNKLFLKC